jgi:methyl-accepting chemotaxis protein-1 (serine sensor receptor)
MSTSAISQVSTAAAPIVPAARSAPAKHESASPSGASPAPQPAAQSATASATAVVSAAAAALKEATETSAQTTKEAARGDRVAQRLLAKESASVAPRSTTPGSIIDKRA